MALSTLNIATQGLLSTPRLIAVQGLLSAATEITGPGGGPILHGGKRLHRKAREDALLLLLTYY